MSPAKIEALGRSIQRLTEGQCSGEDNGYDIESQDELLDALDDLRAELVGPMRWPGTFLAPPEFAALQVAYQREIFRHVPNGCGCEGSPSSIRAGDLALLVKMKEDSLVRIMRVLVVNKMFSEVDEKVFAHTPISTKLADEYVAARLGGIFNELYKASSSLADAIDAGLPNAWEARFGMPMYKYFEKNRESDRGRMAKAMVISSTAEIEELSTMFPWQRFHKVVDIGGGAGHLAAYLARQHPHLQTVNQDLPQVINDQIRRIDNLSPPEKSAYSRVEFEAHDYYSPQSRADADAYILRRCLHNNPDSECVRILKAVVPGLENGGPDARLLINEKLMPAWNSSATRNKTKMLRREDIVMMISVGGKERTLEEFEGLVRETDGRLEVDQVYRGKNHFAVISVKLVAQAKKVTHANGVSA